MRSERRHELQKNSLDTEIVRLRAFFQKHGTKLSWGLLILAVIVLGVVLWNRRAERKRAEVQTQYEQLLRLSTQRGASREEILPQLQELSRQDTVPWVAADAALAIGRMYATVVLTAPTPEGREKALANARIAYQRVIDEFDSRPVAVASAQVGLGKLAEGQGDLDAARKRYQTVLDMPGLAGYPIRTLAEEALKQINSMSATTARLATTLPAWIEEQRNAEAKPPTTPPVGPPAPKK